MTVHLSRRGFLAGAAACMLPPGVSAATGPRVATLDWALLETLIAIGANVVAGTELLQFRDVAVEPAVPAGVADLGLRGTPNFEALRAARPDVIFNSNFYAWADARLSLVAPVESHAIYAPGTPPYASAEAATRAMGGRLDLAAAARRLVEETADRLEAYHAELAGRSMRPVLPINLGDAGHYRVFGNDSMFGEVLARLGLANAWQGATSYSATAPVAIETLAAMPEAWIVLIEPHPPEAMTKLAGSAFWNALPAVRAGRVLALGSINPYGALPAAGRFADLLMGGLRHARHG